MRLELCAAFVRLDDVAGVERIVREARFVEPYELVARAAAQGEDVFGGAEECSPSSPRQLLAVLATGGIFGAFAELDAATEGTIEPLLLDAFVAGRGEDGAVVAAEDDER